MRYMWCKVLLAVSLVIVSTAALVAGNGKITGAIKDASTNEVVVGANVVIEGTTLGGAADIKGAYYILNVPPGTYNVIASAVGYARKIVRGVRVGSDQIVTLDFTLQAEAIGLQEVIVEAQQRVVDPSQTSAKSRISSEEFRSLPIREVYDIIATSASVYKGFVRGGKQFETKTLIDGIDVTDQYYASAADNGPGASTPYLTYNGVIRQEDAKKSSMLKLNVGSIEEATVLTGGVGADYSSATAGVVSYSLREGRGPLSGGVKFKMSNGGLKHMGPDIYNDGDKYLAEKATLSDPAQSQTNRDKGARYVWSPGKYSYGEKPTTEAEITLGGGLTNNVGLYFTGGLFNSYGRLPNEFTRRISSSLKLNYNPTSDIKINVTSLLEDRGRLFGWKNRNFSEDFRFFLEGIPQWDG
ncbi:MAG: carboxypeptidase-like regulatory domain-containing protein, partial [Ignavibacteriales bacterium]|nr:carboxypeptidase-like regulatory domain-containing protein [Ignavibacteriales bacterium]